MTKKNTGKEYEKFVQNLYSHLQNHSMQNYDQISILLNKRITDLNDLEREFDIYWKYQYSNKIYEIVIECKDYASNISLEKVDAFVGKLIDFPNVIGIFATRTGYQSGAAIKAKAHNIELLVCREHNDSDLKTKDNEYLIEKMKVGIQYRSVQITKISIEADIPSDEQFESLNNQVIIDDIKNNEEYSLHELENKLLRDEHNNQYGNFSKEINFEDAYIEDLDKNTRFKLKKLYLEYIVYEPIEQEFSHRILGIIHNISQNSKSMISENKILEIDSDNNKRITYAAHTWNTTLWG